MLYWAFCIPMNRVRKVSHAECIKDLDCFKSESLKGPSHIQRANLTDDAIP